MSKRIVFAAGAAALLAATPAMAQQVSGLYVGAGAGANFLQGNGLNKDDYDVGPAGNLYVGYGFGNGFRTDLEASIRENSHDGNNHQTTYGLMANGYYDFDFGSPFVPYIGAGIGVALVDADFNPSGPGNYFSSTKAQPRLSGHRRRGLQLRAEHGRDPRIPLPRQHRAGVQGQRRPDQVGRRQQPHRPGRPALHLRRRGRGAAAGAGPGGHPGPQLSGVLRLRQLEADAGGQADRRLRRL